MASQLQVRQRGPITLALKLQQRIDYPNRTQFRCLPLTVVIKLFIFVNGLA